MDMKTKKILDYVSMGATVIGLAAQLVGSIVGNKKNTMEIQEAVREELAKQTAQTIAKGGS